MSAILFRPHCDISQGPYNREGLSLDKILSTLHKYGLHYVWWSQWLSRRSYEPGARYDGRHFGGYRQLGENEFEIINSLRNWEISISTG